VTPFFRKNRRRGRKKKGRQKKERIRAYRRKVHLLAGNTREKCRILVLSSSGRILEREKRAQAMRKGKKKIEKPKKSATGKEALTKVTGSRFASRKERTSLGKKTQATRRHRVFRRASRPEKRGEE